jgi:hypothetical protein
MRWRACSAASFVLLFDPGMDGTDSRLYSLVELGGMVVGGWRSSCSAGCSWRARSGSGGAVGIQLEHLLPGKLTHKLAGALLKFAEGLAVVRTPRRLALALAWSLPL